jgi:hypothetical protein
MPAAPSHTSKIQDNTLQTANIQGLNTVDDVKSRLAVGPCLFP